MGRAAILLALTASSLAALDPRLSTTQYLHKSWTEEEGIALPEINALAQTTDGYLWLGTGNGLYRFDGMRFVQWEEPTGEKFPDLPVRGLTASSAGGVWIRTSSTISRLDRGHLIRYPEADRWLAGRNRAIFEDRERRLWLVRLSETEQSPELAALLPGGAFQVYGKADGLPARRIHNVFEDGQSRLWVATDRQLCQWSPGHPAECQPSLWGPILSLSGQAAADSLVADPSGRSVLGISEGDLKALFGGKGILATLPKFLLRDRDDNVWIGTVGQGLVRKSGEKSERITSADGLSNDSIRALLEDREHNVWVATGSGLDRFRDPQVTRISTANGLSSDVAVTVAMAHDGAAWVGTYGGGLNRVAGTRITRYPASSGLPSPAISSLFEDAGQRLWVGTTSGFGYLSHDRFTEVRTSDQGSLNVVFAITTDHDGNVWLGDTGRGLFTVRGGVAQPMAIPGVHMEDVYQLLFARDNALWLGHFKGGITVVKTGSVRNFTANDGLAEGAIQGIAQDRSGTIWIGAKGGLSRFRKGVWTTWGNRHGVPKGGVWGIVEDDHEVLWFMTSEGLSRLRLDTLNQTPDGSPGKLEFTLYGRSDGIRVTPTAVTANPQSARLSDGRLWFCTGNGIAIVDPERIRSNPEPPPVVVEELVVDGKTLDASDGAEIQFRGRQVRIAYNGLSLMVPERVQFRYQLEGLDHQWTDAGSRRYVDYVNLPPAHYRFRVQACNHDGIWNTAGAALPFRIQPYFYETTWFAALCIVSLGLLTWGAHRMRVQMVVTRLEATAHERARLTRELHDSLLQGFVAVVYQLEAVLRQIENAPVAGRQRLERAIEQADRALREARNAMLAMRLPALEKSTLPEALSKIASGMTEGTHIDFHLDVKGRVRQLPYDAQANVFLIGREAIANSVNHANPTRILAGLTYSEKHVRLTVADDGDGFDLAVAAAKHDHWGMTGMRERASQIGATFSVCSSPGEGTTVEVVVPAKG